MDIQLLCELEVVRTGAIHAGVTRNLSRNGSLVEIGGAADVRDGDQIVLRIELPARPLFEQKCMECSGWVVRRHGGDAPEVLLGVKLTTVQFRSAARMAVHSPESDNTGVDSHAL
jgi:hypothetical protein